MNTSPSKQEAWVQFLVKKGLAAKKKKKKKKPRKQKNIVTNSIRALKMVHLKKKKRIKIHVTWNTTQRKLSSMPYLFHSLRHVSKMGDECPIKSHY